jgi:HPr kinase/phosphorylase
MLPERRPGEWAVHATALLLREVGILVRGASGAGKSRLAATLIADDDRFGEAVRLVGDDRIWLRETHGRVLARGDARLAGLIERRGEGLMRRDFEPAVVLGCVVDLVDANPACDIPPRLPDLAALSLAVGAVSLPRLTLPRSLSGPEAALRVRAFVHRLEETI